MASRRRRAAKKDEPKEAPAEQVAAKVEPKPPKPKTEPKKTIFSHPSALRCTGPDRSRPAFQQMTCNTPMKPDGTRKAGSRKRWKCPTCGATRVTEGEQI